jgi:RNA dependent RNA polymerase
MSPSIARKIESIFGVNYVSAVQVRIANCKGMLTVKPGLDGDQVVIRESMRKILDYQEKEHPLYVIRHSTYSAGHLNKQFAIHLNILGAPVQWFLSRSE